MALVNASDDIVTTIIQQKLKENDDLTHSITENADKYEMLLKQVQEMKDNALSTSSSQSPKDDKLIKLENEIKQADIEFKTFKIKLNNSTELLENLYLHADKNEQYLKRDNLIIRGLSNIPGHLKGYKFSQWVARTINNLIPNLDFPILPEYISVSHPLPSNNALSSTVIVRFSIRDVRNEIFYKKKFIKNNNIIITEHLTKRNLALLKTAEELLGPKNTWSSQTKLYGKIGKEIVSIKSMKDIDFLRGMKASYDVQPPAPDDLQPPISSDDTHINVNSSPSGISSKNPDIASPDVSSSPVAPNNKNFNLLARTWPDLSEAQIIAAVNKSMS